MRAFRALCLATATWLCAAPCGSAQEASARLSFEPARAQVGQPVRATLSVQHGRNELPVLAPLGTDDAWVVFAEEPAWTSAQPGDAERATTTWTFELAVLEPGEFLFDGLELKLANAKLAVEAVPLRVDGVLAEGEDAPRPLRGLSDVRTPAEPGFAWAWIGAGVLVLAAAALAWLRFARRSAAPASVPAPSMRLAVLESQPLDTPEDVQAAHYALTRLVREAGDLRAGADRSALTDEEWRAAARAQLDAAGLGDAERRTLEQLFERAGAVKYGSERPTHWATREALASARALAQRLESAAVPREVAA